MGTHCGSETHVIQASTTMPTDNGKWVVIRVAPGTDLWLVGKRLSEKRIEILNGYFNDRTKANRVAHYQNLKAQKSFKFGKLDIPSDDGLYHVRRHHE